MPMIVVLMGVSGSGKTTIGNVLAGHLACAFADADDYHPLANKQKMAHGIPLTDADRQPWLEELNRLLQAWYREGQNGVLACSALKAAYRETLANGMPAGTVRYVMLDGSRELIAGRLATRHHEYMSASLLDSQLATLEPPSDALRIVNDRTPEVVAAEILEMLEGKV